MSDCGKRHTGLFGHAMQGPMNCPFGLALQGRLGDFGNLVVGNSSRSAAPVMVIQTINPVYDKAAAPLTHCFIIEIQFKGNFGVAMPIGTAQYDRVAVGS